MPSDMPIILQAEDGVRDAHECLEFRRVLCRALLGRMRAAFGLNLGELLRLGLPGGVEPDAAGPPPVAIPSARALLLLGDGPSKALLGKAAGQARGTVHQVELGGRPLSAVATFAPHFLIRQPRMKALAWADLRLFATLIA